jgi:hypothetical protein
MKHKDNGLDKWVTKKIDITVIFADKKVENKLIHYPI